MSWKDIPGRAAYLWVYREWLASNPPKNAIVVEVGVALGKSLAALCEMLDEAGRDDIQVYAVDPWAGTERNGEQQTLADKAGGDFTLYAQMMLANAPKAFERIRVIRATSEDAESFFQFKEEGRFETPSLVLLDGDHSYEGVRNDLEVWAHMWPQKGWVIAGDDYHPIHHPGVIRAVDEYLKDLVARGLDYAQFETRKDDDWPTWRIRFGQ